MSINVILKLPKRIKLISILKTEIAKQHSSGKSAQMVQTQTCNSSEGSWTLVPGSDWGATGWTPSVPISYFFMSFSAAFDCS